MIDVYSLQTFFIVLLYFYLQKMTVYKLSNDGVQQVTRPLDMAKLLISIANGL